MKYKFLEHTADIKFQTFGRSIQEVFENSALAVSIYLSRGNKVKHKVKKSIQLKGTDLLSLYYNFLEELVYLLDAESFIVAGAKVKIKEFTLTAELVGDESGNYDDLDHIKAATYAEMYVKKLPDGNYRAQAVLDV